MATSDEVCNLVRPLDAWTKKDKSPADRETLSLSPRPPAYQDPLKALKHRTPNTLPSSGLRYSFFQASTGFYFLDPSGCLGCSTYFLNYKIESLRRKPPAGPGRMPHRPAVPEVAPAKSKMFTAGASTHISYWNGAPSIEGLQGLL